MRGFIQDVDWNSLIFEAAAAGDVFFLMNHEAGRRKGGSAPC